MSQYPVSVEMLADASDFKQKLLSAFPPIPFQGLISTHDECDEGIELRKELPGKTWDEIPSAFIDFNSGSLPLLEPDAIVAFLPAWLLRSMETGGHESVLAEFTMYFLCPGSEDEGWDYEQIGKRVVLFNSAQRAAIRDFLQAIKNNEIIAGWHAYAEYGLKWWVV
jgi:hypothetical protein